MRLFTVRLRRLQTIFRHTQNQTEQDFQSMSFIYSKCPLSRWKISHMYIPLCMYIPEKTKPVPQRLSSDSWLSFCIVILFTIRLNVSRRRRLWPDRSVVIYLSPRGVRVTRGAIVFHLTRQHRMPGLVYTTITWLTISRCKNVVVGLFGSASWSVNYAARCHVYISDELNTFLFCHWQMMGGQVFDTCEVLECPHLAQLDICVRVVSTQQKDGVRSRRRPGIWEKHSHGCRQREFELHIIRMTHVIL